MKNFLKLKIACVVIWACIIGICILFGFQAQSNKGAAKRAPTAQITGNNNSVNTINGDNTTFIVAEAMPSLPEKETKAGREQGVVLRGAFLGGNRSSCQ